MVNGVDSGLKPQLLTGGLCWLGIRRVLPGRLWHFTRFARHFLGSMPWRLLGGSRIWFDARLGNLMWLTGIRDRCSTGTGTYVIVVIIAHLIYAVADLVPCSFGTPLDGVLPMETKGRAQMVVYKCGVL